MINSLIKDMPTQEKPRERLMKFGVENISSLELIAIILKTGTKNHSVKELAGNILASINEVSDLRSVSVNSLTNIHGIGTVKAIELISAIELGRRVYYEKTIETGIELSNPIKIFEYFKYLINDNKQEYFYCLYLDNKKKLIGKRLLFIGTINMSIVHPREIFKYAYLFSASSIICVHNHPSGNPSPSVEDKELTDALVNIGKIQGINVIDHIIVGDNKYYSFYENNNI